MDNKVTFAPVCEYQNIEINLPKMPSKFCPSRGFSDFVYIWKLTLISSFLSPKILQIFSDFGDVEIQTE